MADNTPGYPYVEFTGTVDTTDTGTAVRSVDAVCPIFDDARAADLTNSLPEGAPIALTTKDASRNYVHNGTVYQTAEEKITARGTI